MAELSVGVLDTMISPISEEEKLGVLEVKTKRLLISLLRVLAFIFLTVIILIGPIMLWNGYTTGQYAAGDMYSWPVIIILSVGASLAFVFPKAQSSNGDYNEVSRLFHKIILDNYAIHSKLFRREVKRYGFQDDKPYLIVTGLARAGTTSLLNDLTDHHQMKSPSYANMPLILAPRTWERFYKPKNTAAKERSHKDGVLVNQSSNEAIEEYFFKWASRDAYIDDDGLHLQDVTANQYLDYKSFQSCIRKEPSFIYVAKNNNFILRYASVRSMDEQMKMVVLYREPLSHAASLMEKHRLFCDMQDSDPFVLEYMTWLGHHEFGQGHLPFLFPNCDVPQEDLFTIDYWLKRWIDYYGYLVSLNLSNCQLISYEAYCEAPNDVLNRLFSWMGLDPAMPEKKAFVNQRQVHHSPEAELVEHASAIYAQLLRMGAAQTQQKKE